MKKILLGMALASLGLSFNGYSQVIMTQDFEGATFPALPATWTQMSTGTPTAWFTSSTAGSTWGGLTAAYNLPAHTKYVVVDDAANPNQVHDTLMSPVFAVSGALSYLYLNYDNFFYKATNNSSGKSESAFVLGSTNGGTTWSVIDSLPGDGWNGFWVTSHTALASTFTGPNCRVAFTYSDGTGAILGAALDNIQVLNLTASTAGLTAINYNSITNHIATNGTPVSFTIQNNGIPITTLDMYYTINGGTPVTQSFTGLSIAPYATQTFTFTTTMAGAVAGSNTLKVALSMVNGVVPTEADTTLSSTFAFASSSVQRQGLIEEMSASTCSPCHAFNTSFDPLCLTLNADVPGSNFNVIKYQMNWPSPGDDRSYNPDGLTRRTYYNCNSIPEHWTNGVQNTLGWSYPFSSTDITNYTNQANGSSADKAFMDITATYGVDTFRNKVGVTVSVTPHFTKTSGYHVYIALCDKHYQNTTNTTGQLDYYNVMRKMLPSAGGHAVTSWTDGTAQTFTDTGVTYTNGNWVPALTSLYPTQGSYMFWANPLLNSEVVVFVQEDATKSVMQSFVAIPTSTGTPPPPPPTDNGVGTTSRVDGIKVFPVPAKDQATVRFNLYENSNVTVKVMDYTGKVISEVVGDKMQIGTHDIVIATDKIAPGNYIVMITTDFGSNAERLTVEK